MSDVVALPVMRGCEVLAGREGVHRVVTGVNIIEVPDVHRWLKGGEFLFTSGFPWREDPAELGQVIRELDGIGVAGVAVKLGQYLMVVPPEVVSLADSLAMPLIRLPAGLAYMDVIAPLYQRISARRLWALERFAELKDVFTPLGLDQQSIDRVATALAEEARNTVIMVDLVDEEVVVAPPDGPLLRNPMAHAEAMPAALTQEILDLDLPRSPTIVSLGSGGRALGASLIVERQVQGALVILDDREPFPEFLELALSHAAELVSFLLMTRLSRLAGRKEAGQLFLDSLMSDNLSNEEAVERAVTLGLRLTRPCAALLVGPHPGQRGSPSADQVARMIERALFGLPHAMGAAGDGEQLVLVQTDAGDQDLAQVLERIQYHSGGMGPILIAAGSPLVGVEGVRRSRSEALIAFRAAGRRYASGVVHFAELGVERVLSQIPMNATTLDYINSTIGSVLEHDELFRTLEIFLDCGGNKAATASAIPLHRSSLVYRLNKISALLGVDVDDPVRRIELALAVRLYRIAQLTTPKR